MRLKLMLGPQSFGLIFSKTILCCHFVLGGGKVRERGGILGLFLPDMVSQ